MKIDGSVALTGANRGLGRAYARELVSRGAAKAYGAVRQPAHVTEPGVTPTGLDITVVALIVTAGARLLIPFFATDQGESRFQTLHGIVHMILAVIAFGGLVWAATGLWSTLSHYPAWQGAESPPTIIPWIMLGSVIAVVLAIGGPRLKPFFGLFERLFYLSSITWVLIVAIDLARISG